MRATTTNGPPTTAAQTRGASPAHKTGQQAIAMKMPPTIRPKLRTWEAVTCVSMMALSPDV
jgi:hypothetical protein